MFPPGLLQLRPVFGNLAIETRAHYQSLSLTRPQNHLGGGGEHQVLHGGLTQVTKIRLTRVERRRGYQHTRPGIFRGSRHNRKYPTRVFIVTELRPRPQSCDVLAGHQIYQRQF